MKATKTPGNVTVTLEMSEHEFEKLRCLWNNSSEDCVAEDYLKYDDYLFFETAGKLVKAILYGGQEEIVSNG